MTAAQFIRRRKQFWRTQADAATGIGVSYQAMHLWETGKRPIPKYAEIILELNETIRGLRKEIDYLDDFRINAEAPPFSNIQ